MQAATERYRADEDVLGRFARDVLCIGDGLPTDIRGAKALGLDVLFVANGIHGAETVGPGGLNAAAVADLLRQDGLSANWAIADLVW